MVASGNHGKQPDGTKIFGAITSPANDPAVITVGATAAWGTIARDDDTVATYSSRGPTLIDGLIKPDIVAPGNKVIASSNPNSWLFSQFPETSLCSRQH